MKYLKFLIIAIVALFSFATANAQVVLRARVGGHPHHRGYYYNHRWYHHREFRHHHWRYY